MLRQFTFPFRYMRKAWNRYFHLRKQRQQDKNMLRFYSQFIKPGDRCFDIGAHKGERTNVFLQLGAQVVAVEPQTQLATLLEKNTVPVRSFRSSRKVSRTAWENYLSTYVKRPPQSAPSPRNGKRAVLIVSNGTKRRWFPLPLSTNSWRNSVNRFSVR